MTKKVKVSILVLVWSIVAIQIYVNDWEKQRQTANIVTAFSAAGEEQTVMRISGYGYLGVVDLTVGQKEQMLGNLAEMIGYDGKTNISYTEEQGRERTKLALMTDTGRWTIQLVSVPKTEEKDEVEQYISMEFLSQMAIEESMEEYRQMEQLYESLGMKARLIIEVSLERKGNLVEKDADAFINTLLQDMDAEKVDKVWTKDVHTVYGYTKQINTYHVLNGEKVNLQLAFIYEEDRDKTIIKMGVPLLESSY